MLSPASDCKIDALKIKEWEVGMLQEEIAASQGITIRRRPPTGPPLHYVGPFEFCLPNEDNSPRNILEEIIWTKDQEVSHVISSPVYEFCFRIIVFFHLFISVDFSTFFTEMILNSYKVCLCR